VPRLLAISVGGGYSQEIRRKSRWIPISRVSAVSDSIFDDDEPFVSPPSPPPADVLRIYQTGELTVVGFAGQDVPDEVCIAHYREQLMRLLDEVDCKVLAIDCSGVKLLPSGLLGVLTTLRKRVDRLEIYNPSEDIQEVLRLTKLDQFFEIRKVDWQPGAS